MRGSHLNMCYIDDLLLLPLLSTDAKLLSLACLGFVDPVIADCSTVGGDNVTSSDAISVNTAGDGDGVSVCVTFGADVAFLLTAFFLTPLRALVVTALFLFFWLPLFLTFESLARLPFFSLSLAFGIMINII